MQIVNMGWSLLRHAVKKAGPYMLLELLLPGGTVFALLLYIYRSGALTALQPMPVICHQYAYCQTVVCQRVACDLPTLSARSQ